MAIIMRDSPPDTCTLADIQYNLSWLQEACTKGQYLVCDNLIVWFIARGLFPYHVNNRWHISYEEVVQWLDIASMVRRLELINKDLKLQNTWGRTDLFLWRMLSHEIANHRIWLHFNSFNIMFNHDKRQYSHLEGPLVAKRGRKR